MMNLDLHDCFQASRQALIGWQGFERAGSRKYPLGPKFTALIS